MAAIVTAGREKSQFWLEMGSPRSRRLAQLVRGAYGCHGGEELGTGVVAELASFHCSGMKAWACSISDFTTFARDEQTRWSVDRHADSRQQLLIDHLAGC